MANLQHLFRRLVLLLVSLSLPAAGATLRFPADQNHSTVGFNVPILGFGKVTGKFTDFDIVILFDEKEAAKSTVKASIKTASVNTGIADRDTHLRTADFFSAEKHPEITFESTRIEKRSEGHFIAHGTFTMRGVSKEIALPFALQVIASSKPDGTPALVAVVKWKLNRRDYGLTWKHRDVPDFVGDEVEVDLAITTRRGTRVESK